MQDNSDPEYNPLSENSDDDDDDNGISSQPEVISSTKSYQTEYDQDSDSYSSGNTSKESKLVAESDHKKDTTLSKRSSIVVKKQTMAFMFHCSYCYFQTPQRHYLKGHIKSCRKISDPKRFWGCPKCTIRYSLEDLLDKQSIPRDLTVLGKQVFYCPVCSLEVKNKSEAPILDKVYPSLRHFTCPNCKEKLDGASGLKRHLIGKHGVTVLYKCEYCEFSSPESDSLLEHKKTHSALEEMGLIQCSHCNFEFLTMKEFKEHMKKVNYEKMGKEKASVEIQKSRDLDEEKADEEGKIDVIDNLTSDSVADTADIAKWQLRCTLCEYVNYSKTSCERHVKNKHRSSGHSIVKFNKYYENEFKGSIEIGKIKGGADAEQSSTQDLLKILDWTQSDGEDIPEEEMVTDNVATGEVITIEMASDSEDEENLQESGEQANSKPPESKKRTVASKNLNRNDANACKVCSYVGKNKVHLSIHQQLMHQDDIALYTCSQTKCSYRSEQRVKFRHHLIRYHKAKLEIFYPSNMKCWDCAYTGKRPHHLLLHRQNAHKRKNQSNKVHKGDQNSTEPSKDQPRVEKSELPFNYQPSVPLRKNTEKSKPLDDVKQQRSQEKASKRLPLADNIPSKPGGPGTETDRQTGVKHSQLRCRQCGMKHRDMYNLAWHMFKSHNNTSELRKWRLRCKECNYENNSTSECHKHGVQHKMSLVRFQKYYVGRFKGAIGFRYKQPETCSDDLQKPEVDVFERQEDPLQFQDEVSVEAIVPPKRKRDAYSDEVDKAEPVENELGDAKNDDSDLFFVKKEEFFTCSQCNYETKNESYIPLHQVLVHQPKISIGRTKYQCRDCTFNTKYRHSIRRHLDKVHSYNTKEFYTKEQALLSTRKPRETKFVEELPTNHECRLCVFSDQDKYMLDWHMSNVHGKKTELLKWKIHCSLCEFQSSCTNEARLHAQAKHSDITSSKTIKFVKYYENKSNGYFDYKIDKGKVHYCNKCNYSSTTLDGFKRHYKYCSGSKQEQKSIIGKSKNADLDSEIGGKHEIMEDIEKDQDELIQIKTDRDIDDETKKEQDLSHSEEEYEHYESLPPEDFIDSKSAERHKEGDSDDQVNDDPNFSDIDEEPQQNNEDIAVNRLDKHSNHGKRKASLKSDEGSEGLSDKNNELKEQRDHIYSTRRSKRLRITGKISLSDNENNGDSFENPKNNAEDSKKLRTPKKKQRSSEIKTISFKSDDNYNSKEGDESSDSDYENLKGDQKYDSKRQKSYLPDGVSTIKNKCIAELCNYTSENKSHLKRHCINVHSYGRMKMDQIFANLDQYKCDLCKFQTATLKAMHSHQNIHQGNNNTSNETKKGIEERKIISCTRCKGLYFKDLYKLACHRFTMHGDNTELLKWTLRCTLCTYETRSTKYAHRHGVKHTSTTEPTVVIFEKFYEDALEGTIPLEYGIRVLHRCSLCNYVAGTWECLNKHLKRHRKTKLGPPSRFRKIGQNFRKVKETNSIMDVDECKFKSPVCPKKDFFSDKYQWANHMFEVHGDVSEVMKCFLKCPSCSYETHYTKYAYQHGKAHCSTTTPTTLKFQKKYDDKEEGFYICRYGTLKLHRCSLCEFVTTRRESLRRHFQRHKNKSFRLRNKHKLINKADAAQEAEEGLEVDSDADETKMKSDNNLGSYSKKQILDIIGLGNKLDETVVTKDNSTENKRKRNSKISDNNEVITIEIVADLDDDDGITETLNPFAGKLIIEQESIDYKCSNCKYTSDSIRKLTDHAKSCVQDPVPRNKLTKKYTCLLCQKDLPNRGSLQKHTNVHAEALDNPALTVTFSEFTNDVFFCDIELTANKEGIQRLLPRKLEKVSYKCWMCGTVIVAKKTLPNHTYLHAREDNDDKLKVRFSKFVNDQLEGTIIMHADPNYVPRTKRQQRSPEPEYDPSLPVFSCKECNFKSNTEPALNKHKNLHWTAEKDALYKAQKWFTCSLCFFHCFDIGTYKRHCEGHKKRYTGIGRFKKLGND